MDSLFFIFFLSILILIFGTAALAGLKAAPYVPTRQKDIKRLVELAEIKPGELVYDLGAGDGRLVLATAKIYQAKAVGFEMSILPYLVSRLRVYFSRLNDRANILYKDFYQADFSPADVIVCFLTPMAMSKLKPKFARELKSGARIVSYAFEIKDWLPDKISKPSAKDTTIFRYLIK